MADQPITANKWTHRAFESGTQVVISNEKGCPWLYIFGPNTGSDVDNDMARATVCCEVADFLNGDEPRPAWFDDLERSSESCLVGIDGTKIIATGPVYDANPPHLDWRERKDDDACDARARLIDRLSGVSA